MNPNFKPVAKVSPITPKGPAQAKFTPPPPKPVVPVQKAADKPMFPGKGVSSNIILEPYWIDHPLCANLSVKDLSRVRNIVNKADIASSGYIINYATDLRTKFSELVDNIATEANAAETGIVNTVMTTVVDMIAKASPSKLLDPKLPKWWEILIGRVSIDRYKDNRNTDRYIRTIHDRVDGVEAAIKVLISNIKDSIKRVDELNELFETNRDNFVILNLHVIAGRIIVEQHEKTILPKMRKKVKEDDMFQVQEYNYFKESVDRFSRKIDDLELTAEMVLSNVPHIQLVKTNIQQTADRVQRVALTTCPAWKQQMSRFETSLRKVGISDVAKAIKQFRVEAASTIERAQSEHNSMVALFTK